MMRKLLIGLALVTAGLSFTPNAAAACLLDGHTSIPDVVHDECDGGWPIEAVLGWTHFAYYCVKEVGLELTSAQCDHYYGPH